MKGVPKLIDQIRRERLTGGIPPQYGRRKQTAHSSQGGDRYGRNQ